MSGSDAKSSSPVQRETLWLVWLAVLLIWPAGLLEGRSPVAGLCCWLVPGEGEEGLVGWPGCGWISEADERNVAWFGRLGWFGWLERRFVAGGTGLLGSWMAGTKGPRPPKHPTNQIARQSQADSAAPADQASDLARTQILTPSPAKQPAKQHPSQTSDSRRQLAACRTRGCDEAGHAAAGAQRHAAAADRRAEAGCAAAGCTAAGRTAAGRTAAGRTAAGRRPRGRPRGGPRGRPRQAAAGRARAAAGGQWTTQVAGPASKPTATKTPIGSCTGNLTQPPAAGPHRLITSRPGQLTFTLADVRKRCKVLEPRPAGNIMVGLASWFAYLAGWLVGRTVAGLFCWLAPWEGEEELVGWPSCGWIGEAD